MAIVYTCDGEDEEALTRCPLDSNLWWGGPSREEKRQETGSSSSSGSGLPHAFSQRIELKAAVVSPATHKKLACVRRRWQLGQNVANFNIQTNIEL